MIINEALFESFSMNFIMPIEEVLNLMRNLVEVFVDLDYPYLDFKDLFGYTCTSSIINGL